MAEITGWHGRMTPRDYAAGLTPAGMGAREPVWSVRLDMNARPALAVIEMAAGDTTVGTTFQAKKKKCRRGTLVNSRHLALSLAGRGRPDDLSTD